MKKKTARMLVIVLMLTLLILDGYILADYVRTDNTPPEIVLDTAEISLSVTDPRAVLFQGVTAWDEVDGDVSDTLIIESIYGITKERDITVTYAATDRSGNVAKIQRIARFTDYRQPRFTLDGPLVFELSGAWDVMEVIGAEDVFEGNIRQRIKATMLTSGSSVTEEGTHGVQFQVTNSIGDTVRLVLPVEVYPAGSYDAQLSLTDYLIYLPVGGNVEVEDYLLGFESRFDNLDLRQGIPEGMDLRVTGEVDTQTPGVYPVVYTASYTEGDRTSTGYTKLLVVVGG